MRWWLASALLLGGCDAIFGLTEGTLGGGGGSGGAGPGTTTGVAGRGGATTASAGGAGGSGGKATTSPTATSAGGTGGVAGSAGNATSTSTVASAGGTGGKPTTSSTTASAGGGGAAGSTTMAATSATSTTGTGGKGGAGGGGATVASTTTTATASTSAGTGGTDGGASTTASTTSGTGGGGGNGCDAGAIPAPTLHATWPMPNPPATGLPNAASYDTNTPGVVLDQVTGLMWQEPPGPSQKWSDAQGYCQCLSLAGHSDWRVPSVVEIVSINDYTVGPGLSELAFPAPSGESWSSTPVVAALQANSAWAVAFGASAVVATFKNSTSPATRCVRVGKMVAGGYSEASGTVVDAATGLTWQQTTGMTGYDQTDATTYCAANTPMLPTGQSPWRLPSVNELYTLVDWTQYNPTINPLAFPGTSITTAYWTSSEFVGDPIYMAVDFQNGSTSGDSPLTLNLVRCVH